MEIGETVSVKVPQDPSEDEECPFEHKPPPDDATKNELGGIGTKLGTNMSNAKGVGSHTHKTGDMEPNPRDADLKSVFIKVVGEVVELDGNPLPYPVTCAAHHLIPAQEALKGHNILKFMCKNGENQDFLNGSKAASAAVKDSRVWGNVGYNVNGCHNGVWLPGNYAVGGGKGAVEIWKSRPSARRKLSNDEAAQRWAGKVDLSESEWESDVNDEENEVPPKDDPKEVETQKEEEASSSDDDPMEVEPTEVEGNTLVEALTEADFRKYALIGTNYKIDDENPKWAYVKAAMDTFGGQFHDRHADYSGEVKKYLTKIYNAYNSMYKRSTGATQPCKQCQDAKQPKGASLVGPPRQLIGRLVSCSEFFRRHLAPTDQPLTAMNIYTSAWQKAWFEQTLAKRETLRKKRKGEDGGEEEGTNKKTKIE